MGDKLNKTTTIDAKSLAEAWEREFSSDSDMPPAIARALNAAQDAAERETIRADFLQAVLSTVSSIIASAGMAITLGRPKGGIVPIGAQSDKLAPSFTGGAAVRIDQWEGLYGIMRTVDGMRVPPEDWPMARALRGEIVAWGTYLLGGRVLRISAARVRVRSGDAESTWGVCVFHEIGGTGLESESLGSEVSDG